MATLTLLMVGLFALGALALLSAVVFLYRFLVRRRLFPQLPRLWQGDRKRCLLAGGLFVLASLGFVATVAVSPTPAPAPAPPREAQEPGDDRPLGPSFQGPPAAARPTPPAAEERVLPPAKPAEAPSAGVAEASPPAPSPAPPAEPVAALPPPAPEKSSPAGEEKPAAPPLAGGGQMAPVAPAKKAPSPEPPARPGAVPAAMSAAPAQPPAAPAKPQPAGPPAPAGPRPYAICLASFKEARPAAELAARLKPEEPTVRVVAVELGAKGHWHRVCVGEFPDQAQALARLKTWREGRRFDSPFLTRLP